MGQNCTAGRRLVTTPLKGRSTFRWLNRCKLYFSRINKEYQTLIFVGSNIGQRHRLADVLVGPYKGQKRSLYKGWCPMRGPLSEINGRRRGVSRPTWSFRKVISFISDYRHLVGHYPAYTMTTYKRKKNQMKTLMLVFTVHNVSFSQEIAEWTI